MHTIWYKEMCREEAVNCLRIKLSVGTFLKTVMNFYVSLKAENVITVWATVISKGWLVI
jgi:hypothetical protein